MIKDVILVVSLTLNALTICWAFWVSIEWWFFSEDTN